MMLAQKCVRAECGVRRVWRVQWACVGGGGDGRAWTKI